MNSVWVGLYNNSILVFNLTLILSEGQAGETWETWNEPWDLECWGALSRKVMFMVVACFCRHLLTECWERWSSWFLSASLFRRSDVRSASSSVWPGCATWQAERATWSKPSPTYTSDAWPLHQQWYYRSMTPYSVTPLGCFCSQYLFKDAVSC